MTHVLKTWIQYFSPQEKGDKLFELRKDDRPYEVGDKFISQEFDSKNNQYTGKETTYVITYILRDAEMFGLKQGYCILQLKPLNDY